MSNELARLQQELSALRQSIAVPGLPEPVVAMLRQQIAAKEAELARLRGTVQGPRVEHPHAGRDNYIATQQVVNNFFGGQPGEDGEDLLRAYLDALVGDCQQLRLYRLTGRRQGGNEQRSPTHALRLQDVYTSLTTDGAGVVRYAGRTTAGRVRRFLEHLGKVGRTPDDVAPERVILPVVGAADQAQAWYGLESLRTRGGEHPGLADLPDDQPVYVRLLRPELALEAIAREARLVLLGEPGAGKSTALRYLALLLALRLRGEKVRIPGWPDGDAPVPIVVPLGRVAAALSAGASGAYAALIQAIGAVLEDGLRAGLRRFIEPALREGGVLLLCDGLDELPAAVAGGGPSPRSAVAAALRRLAGQTRARIVVTSRVLPYQAEGDWKLLPADGWVQRVVEPLAFGQAGAFVHSWYEALADSDPDLARGNHRERAELLVRELASVERLQPLVRSPLLLTMIAILHYNTGDVPRDRAKLYEECVLLLLERWEPERQPGVERKSLVDRLGLTGLEPLRRVLEGLAYEVHQQPPGDDGRGLIDGEKLDGRILRFFERTAAPAEAGARLAVFRDALRSEEAGLLQERGDEGYAFPHLTFQEYLAACHLANQTQQMTRLAYKHWCGDDRERWREVLLLLMGRLHQQGIAGTQALLWLQMLIAATLEKKPKELTQNRRDTLLAALCYAELEERDAFAASEFDLEQLVATPLRRRLAELLDTPDAAITPADRIAVARVLGRLGDPRFPLTLEDWRRELARRGDRLTADGDHYWRYVAAGRYTVGGWDEGEKSAKLELAPFWVARLPITVAQFTAFVTEGYRPEAERWWTPEGRKWKRARTQPENWGQAPYHEQNQPVTLVTWYEATAYCAWLTERLGEALPAGHVVRLPTEAEWEAAASTDGQGGRRTYPWGEEPATGEQAIHDVHQLNAAAPVGCCPAGAAPCGALDLAGNVWEWTCSSHEAYPRGAHQGQKDFTTGEWDVPLCGGSYHGGSTDVRCGARNGGNPLYWISYLGFRVIMAPPLVHPS